MIILAHRANISGPDPANENSLAACERALVAGFGLETDLRKSSTGTFYISHDAGTLTASNDLTSYTALFSGFPDAELAINVKELGHEVDLIGLMQEKRLGAKSFYFDFELLEPRTPGAAQRKIKSLSGGDAIRLASRVSDRNESLEQCLSIPGEIVWADEFDSLWLTEETVRRIHAAGRKVYAISPELHGFDYAVMKQRWVDFKSWQLDGVCTDYALEAQAFFTNQSCH